MKIWMSINFINIVCKQNYFRVRIMSVDWLICVGCVVVKNIILRMSLLELGIHAQ